MTRVILVHEFPPHGISNIMPQKKFQQLFRFFHLNDNSKQVPYGQTGHDKLFKVRKLLDLLSPLFESEFEMHQSCTIDEAMIPFKGRLRFKQYMKDKPTKWGIKVFILADAPTGYVKRLQVYTGKGLDSCVTDVGLCTQVVLDLMKGFDHMGVQLYTDNFYTSPLLYFRLYKRQGINACGTVRPNRLGFPSQLVIKATGTNRGTYQYLSNGPLLACSWVDKRSLYLLTTMHIGERVGNPTVRRRQADGSQADVSCPPCLPDYQKHMRGVDRGDQLESYYNVGRKSKKWWRRIFFFCLEVSILNSFCLEKMVRPSEHQRLGRKKRDILSFRLQLAKELIGSFSSGQRGGGRPRSAEHTQLDRLNSNLGHWPTHVDKKGNCAVCLAVIRRRRLPIVGNRHELRIQCEHCKEYLCIASGRNCFRKYHTLVDFSQ